MINEAQANLLVKRNQAEWEGWTLVIYSDADGYSSKNGIYRNGRWIQGHRFDIQKETGKWNVPTRLFNSNARVGRLS